MGPLTADDRTLLRKVFRAAHAKSWTRVHNDPDWKEPGSRYWSDDRNTPIELDKHGWVKTPISEVECVDIQLVVDVLVAVGVLPVELRSVPKLCGAQFAKGSSIACTYLDGHPPITKDVRGCGERDMQHGSTAYDVWWNGNTATVHGDALEPKSKPRHRSLSEMIADANAEAAKFNAEFPPGTPVEYWSGVREGDGRIGHTKGEAFSSNSGQAVVFLDNASSYHALTHVKPLAEVKA